MIIRRRKAVLYNQNNYSTNIVISENEYSIVDRNRDIKKTGTAGFVTNGTMYGVYVDEDGKLYFVIGKNNIISKKYDVTSSKVYVENKRTGNVSETWGKERNFKMYINHQLVENIIYKNYFDDMDLICGEEETEHDILLEITEILNDKKEAFIAGFSIDK